MVSGPTWECPQTRRTRGAFRCADDRCCHLAGDTLDRHRRTRTRRVHLGCFLPHLVPQRRVRRRGKPPGYLLVVTNTGGAATSGEFTIVDSLPGRLSFSTAAGAPDPTVAGNCFSRSAVGRTVSCSGGEPSLKPGETAWVLVPVNVAPGTSTGVLNKVAVSGGGAPPMEAKIGTIIGDGVPDFDFLPNSPGLNGAISNSEGAAATLAGSHPNQLLCRPRFSNWPGCRGTVRRRGRGQGSHLRSPVRHGRRPVCGSHSPASSSS